MTASTRALGAGALVLAAVLVSFAWRALREPEDAGGAPVRSPPAPAAAATPSAAPIPVSTSTRAPLKVQARPAPAPTVIVRGAWGSRPGEFGRKLADESNPEAPMAIAAAGADTLVVDQVNLRIQRFRGGAPQGSIPIADSVQDVALGAEGRTIALDRLVDQNVKIYSAEGKLENEIPLAGKGIPSPAHTTAVISDDQGIWVESEHSTLVRVADAKGNADTERPELPGRPTRDGQRVISLAIRDAARGEIVVTSFQRSSLEAQWSQAFTLGHQVIEVLMLDSDRRGNVYFAAATVDEGPPPTFTVQNPSIALVRLDPSGALSGRLDVPGFVSGDETRRPLALDDEGAVLLMRPTETGLEIVRYRFEP